MVPSPRAATPAIIGKALECRACGQPVDRTFVDLGRTPLANALSTVDDASPDPAYPLKAYVCDRCFLVQLPVFEAPEKIFDDYPYFSSTSSSWLDHARKYAEDMVARFQLPPSKRIVEIASNDGYLLQYFQQLGHPVLGIEPASTVARAAQAKGIPTIVQFFGKDLAAALVKKGERADLLIANNVLAHVPDLHGFVEGLRTILAPDGVLTIEVPHLLRLVERVQFDTIYHEHFSYFSLAAAIQVLQTHGLSTFDVQELETHGGSIRIFAAHASRGVKATKVVRRILEAEQAAGLDRAETYAGFQHKVDQVTAAAVEFLKQAKLAGKVVVGYGAPAKATTLFNYGGVGPDLLPFTVDRSAAKQGRTIPGVRIPIKAPEAIRAARPDYLVILPWNLKDEIMQQTAFVREWGGKFVVLEPRVQVLD